ncbi:MAG: EutN/CcmL family microcompartment protein [Planctomycetes bacterium]|nr:EutN/CcmL family microcompartment protein [Planctomycetota bacterium]
MDLARVIGRVVSTLKIEGLEGVTLQWIQPLHGDGTPLGRPLVACDTAHSGIGDLVYYIDGREASFPLPVRFVPVDATIVGHVEEVGLKSNQTFPRFDPKY